MSHTPDIASLRHETTGGFFAADLLVPAPNPAQFRRHFQTASSPPSGHAREVTPCEHMFRSSSPVLSSLAVPRSHQLRSTESARSHTLGGALLANRRSTVTSSPRPISRPSLMPLKHPGSRSTASATSISIQDGRVASTQMAGLFPTPPLSRTSRLLSIT